jgi:cation transport ATPase
LTKIRRFFRDNKLFCLTMLASAIGIGLLFGGFETASNWVLGAVAGINVLVTLADIYSNLRIRIVIPEIMSALAVVTALIIGESITAVAVVLVVYLRKFLLSHARRKAISGLETTIPEPPKSARLLRGRKEIDTPVSEVNMGSKLLIKVGEIVPLDGTDSRGNLVASGTTVEIEDLILRVTADSSHSRLYKLIKLARDASRSDSPFVRYCEQSVLPFILMSLTLAGAVWYISGDVQRFLSVLVVATSSTLIIAPPLALLGGLSQAARRNIFVRNGKVLETLALTRSIMLERPSKLNITRVAVEYAPAKLSTGDKVRLIESIPERPTIYVGTNEKDVPIMTASDVSIALGANDIANESADVIILSGNLNHVAASIDIAKHTFRAARLAVATGIVLSITIQIIFATGKFSPLYGVGLTLLVDAVVIFVALRARGRVNDSK